MGRISRALQDSMCAETAAGALAELASNDSAWEAAEEQTAAEAKKASNQTGTSFYCLAFLHH